MKLLTSFSHIFDRGEQFNKFTQTLINYLQGYEVSFCFVPVPERTGSIANKINTRYIADLFASTYYLFNNGSTATVNKQILTKGNLELQTDSLNFFRLNRARNIKSLFMVYRPTGGNKFYMPRMFRMCPTCPIIYYDAFPSGTTQLFDLQTCVNPFLPPERTAAVAIQNARIEINNILRPHTVNPAFGIPKLLTLTNIQESISGFGARISPFLRCAIEPEGAGRTSNFYTGGISFILGVNDDLPETLREDINLFLMDYFLTYQGTILLDDSRLSFIVGQNVSVDLFPRFHNEWFTITELILIDPTYIGLTIINNVLVGIPDVEFIGFIRVQVNTTGSTSFHEIAIRVVKIDPLVIRLPDRENISGIFISRTAVGLNSFGDVFSWEDARRNENFLITTMGRVRQNSDTSLTIDRNSRLGGRLSGKTYVFVYKQTEYGIREFTNNLPDIEGTGVLWTTPRRQDIFGTTVATRLSVQVGRITIDLFRYQLPLNEYFIIIARGDEELATTFLLHNRGSLKVFGVWTNRLNDQQTSQLFTLFSEFLTDLRPQHIVRSNRIFQVPEISLNLLTLISDPLNRNLIFTTPTPNFTILRNNLIFNAVKDKTVSVTINVSNGVNTVTFQVVLVIQVKNNQLYLALRQNNIEFQLLFVVDESIVKSGENIIRWDEYSSNSNILTLSEGSTSLYGNPNYSKSAVDFGTDGNSHFTLNPPVLIRSIFIVVYLTDLENISSWLGNNLIPLALFRDSVILENIQIPSLEVIALNGTLVGRGEKLRKGFNTVYLQYDEPVALSTFSIDRGIVSRSMRGAVYNYITFNSNQNPRLLNKITRDYFDPIREVLILRFNNNVFNESQVCQTNSSQFQFSSISNRGSFSLVLNSSFLEFRSELFRTEYEDFTIRFFINREGNINLATVFTTELLTCFIEDNKLALGIKLYDRRYGEFQLEKGWQFIVISRYNNQIYLIYNTTVVNIITVNDNYESESFSIGSPTFSREALLLTEFVFVRRFSTTSVSSVPTSSYIAL